MVWPWPSSPRSNSVTPTSFRRLASSLTSSSSRRWERGPSSISAIGDTVPQCLANVNGGDPRSGCQGLDLYSSLTMPSETARSTNIPEITRKVVAARQRAAAGVKGEKMAFRCRARYPDEIDQVVCEPGRAVDWSLRRTRWRFWPPAASGGASGPRSSDLDPVVLCAEEPGPRSSSWRGPCCRRCGTPRWTPATRCALTTSPVPAGPGSGGGHRLAGRPLSDWRCGAVGAVPGRVPGQRGRHGRRELRGPAARGAGEASQPFGDTIFLLEPDLKNGPGGMRDLCMGRWAAEARFGSADPGRLRDPGVMTERLATAFEAAREWLLRVRIAMHASAGGGRISSASRCRRRWRRCCAPTSRWWRGTSARRSIRRWRR